MAAAYLRSAVDPTDDEAILYLLNSPKRGIGKRSIEHFQKIAEDNQCSLLEAFQTGSVLKSGSSQESALEKLIQLITQYQKKQESERPSSLIRELLHDSGYWEEVLALKDPESKSRILNYSYPHCPNSIIAKLPLMYFLREKDLKYPKAQNGFIDRWNGS